MSNIAESFQILYDIKEDIRNSIEGKGVAVGDAPFTDYASKIDEIVVDPMDGSYDEGFAEGFTQGDNEGYNRGFGDGRSEGEAEGYNKGFNQGYADGTTNGISEQKGKLTTITVDENGVYSREDGYSEVTVNVDTDFYYEEGFNNGFNNGKVEGYNEGKTDGENAIKANMQSITITKNGPYSDERGYKQVIVNVTDENGDYNDGYSVGYENGYSVGYSSGTTDGYNNGFNNGKTQGTTEGYNSGFSAGKTEGYGSGVTVGQNEIINKTIELTVTENGTYPTSNNVFFNSVTVAVPQPTDIQGAYDSGYADGYEDGIANSDGTIVFKPSSISFSLYSAVVDGNVVIDVSDLTSFSSKLQYAYFNNRKSPLLLNTNHLTNANRIFYYANFEEALYFDTSNVTDMDSMFTHNSGLTVVPLYITSNVTNMAYMFQWCTNLESVPQFDTSSVTKMTYMFGRCTNLKSVPQFDTSNVTDMSFMFAYCENLITAPQLNTTKVTNFKEMFNSCKKLTTAPKLDTSAVTDIRYLGDMFRDCVNLTTAPTYDVSNIEPDSIYNYIDMFRGCTSLVDFGGYIGLKESVSFQYNTSLSRESMLNVFNLAETVSGKYIVINDDINNRLTADDIAIVTNKGWTIRIS